MLNQQRFLVLVLLILLLTSFRRTTTPGFSLEEKVRSTRIPFKLLYNLIVVPVKINGKKYDMILDTGVRSFVLFGNRHKKLINTEIRVNVGGWGENAPQTGYVSALNKVRIGNVVGRGVSLLVVNSNSVMPMLGSKVDGILGYEIFSRFVVEIDYSNKFLYISKKPKGWSPKGYIKLPIEIRDTKPYINSRMTMKNGNEVNLRLMVDTGAGKEVLLNRKTLSDFEKVYHTMEIGYGLSGEIIGFKMRDIELSVNAIDLGRFKCEVARDLMTDNNGIVSHGVIGSKALKRYKVIFDYSNLSIYLKANNTVNSEP